jgi:hypothetical protein
VTDTGAGDGDFGMDWTRPATVYSFDVSAEDGTFGNRKVFAFSDVGLPDGKAFLLLPTPAPYFCRTSLDLLAQENVADPEHALILLEGIKSDTNGNIYIGAGDGIHIHAPSGVLLGKIFSGVGTGSSSSPLSFPSPSYSSLRLPLSTETEPASSLMLHTSSQPGVRGTWTHRDARRAEALLGQTRG